MKVQIIVTVDVTFADGRPDPDPHGDSHWDEMRAQALGHVRDRIPNSVLTFVDGLRGIRMTADPKETQLAGIHIPAPAPFDPGRVGRPRKSADKKRSKPRKGGRNVRS